MTPAKHYPLKAPQFIDPRIFRWLPLEATVMAGWVQVGPQPLELEQPLADGTRVRVWCNRNFYCQPLADIEAREAEVKRQHAQELEQERQRANEQRQQAKQHNAALNIPVRWQSATKDVLSGLEMNSWGDGRNKRTVQHVQVLEPLKEGRLERAAGEFLCSRDTGKQWTGHAHEQWQDGDNEPYDAPVSCKACLKIAQRWQASPELTRALESILGEG